MLYCFLDFPFGKEGETTVQANAANKGWSLTFTNVESLLALCTVQYTTIQYSVSTRYLDQSLHNVPISSVSPPPPVGQEPEQSVDRF